MKLIGLDIGEKRIGVSLADTSVRIASPHSTIIADGTEFDQIKHLMDSENTNYLVVGLPRNNQGGETAQTELVRMFALKLESRGAKVKFQDESLTSVLAERRLKLRKKPYRKEDIDAEAATIILQDFIENFKAQPSSSEPPTEPIEPKTPRQKSTHKFIAPTVITAIVAALSIAGIWFASGTTPAGDNPLRQPFTITEGQSTSQIAHNLQAAGLIKNPTIFTIVARLTRASIPAKTHFISSSEDVWQILDQISID